MNSVTSTPRDLTTDAPEPGVVSLSDPDAGSASGKEPARVLVVEPHPTLRTVLVQRLRQDGHLTAAVSRASEALELCQDQSPDLLVSAEILDQSSALRLSEHLRCPVVS